MTRSLRPYIAELYYWDNTIGSLETASPAAAVQIGELMPFLDTRHNGLPISLEELTWTIESPDHDQLVATRDRRIVGATAINLTWGPYEGKQARIGDVVVHPDYRGQGIFGGIWNFALEWARQRRVTALNFESETWRQAAQAAYRRLGATPQEDAVHFTFPIPHKLNKVDNIIQLKSPITGIVSENL